MSEAGAGEIRVPDGCHQIIGRPADDVSIAIVASRYNAEVVERLLHGAVEALERNGVDRDRVTVVLVPGAWELPLTCRRLAEAGGHHAVVTLGCVIRGDTPHFDYVCAEAARGHHRGVARHGRPGRVRRAHLRRPAAGGRPLRRPAGQQGRGGGRGGAGDGRADAHAAAVPPLNLPETGPLLDAGDLVLRPPLDADLPRLVEAFADAEVARISAMSRFGEPPYGETHAIALARPPARGAGRRPADDAGDRAGRQPGRHDRHRLRERRAGPGRARLLGDGVVPRAGRRAPRDPARVRLRDRRARAGSDRDPGRAAQRASCRAAAAAGYTREGLLR